MSLIINDLSDADLHGLSKHIPRYRPDRHFIVNESVVHNTRQGKIVDNATLVKYFDHADYDDLPSKLDDILHGVARLEWGNTRPLNKAVLYRLLCSLPILSKAAMIDALGVGDRQARRYLSACVVAMRMIENEIDVDSTIDNDALLVARLEQERMETQ